MDHIPDYLEARVRRPIPSQLCVVPGTTPIIAFGDFMNARVATLGLNPSRQEFLTRRGELLEGSKSRFETLRSLGVSSLEAAPISAVKKVIETCRAYFEPNANPYMAWFGQLERLLAKIGASYLDNSACHLDLVQWATDPTWAALDDTTKSTLLAADVPFLIEQLRRHNVRVLLLNGRSVISQLERSAHCLMEQLDSISWGRTAALIYGGHLEGVHVTGWTPNLQSSHGVTNELRKQIAARVAQAVGKV